MLVIANSPVREKTLAKAVRDIWSSTNAAQRLLDSFLFDYSTEGVFNGESLDGWDVGNRLQCQAALRMLFYFPEETFQLLAARLRRLDVRKPPEDRAHWMDSYLTNGVRADKFVKAVAWSDQPAIRREVLDIFKRTTDTQILLAALPGIDAKENEVVRQRLNKMIDQLPAEEEGPFGDGYNLFLALGERLGSDAKPTFLRYLKSPNVQRWQSMARVLHDTRKEWAVELLWPALTDKREVMFFQNIRVCDVAAESISLSRPDLPFKMEGDHENLDRQIAIMRTLMEGARP
jgi:hypothetical protein